MPAKLEKTTAKTAVGRGGVVGATFASKSKVVQPKTTIASSRNFKQSSSTKAVNAEGSKSTLKSTVKPPLAASATPRNQVNGNTRPPTSKPLPKSGKPTTTATPNNDSISSNQKPEPALTRTSDSLQVAAQLLPWIYMTSTLDTCFQSAQTAALKALEAREKQLSEDEADISDQRVRLETERLISFYDALSSTGLAKKAPEIMQTFLRHEVTCARLTTDALSIASQAPQMTVQPHNDMLDKLEQAQTQGRDLELKITQLLGVDAEAPSETPSYSQILSVFSACLPVLRARLSNLSIARELVASSKASLAMTLQIESLNLST